MAWEEREGHRMNVLSLSLSLSGLEMAVVARRTRPTQVKEAHISRFHHRVLLRTQKDAVKGRAICNQVFPVRRASEDNFRTSHCQTQSLFSG